MVSKIVVLAAAFGSTSYAAGVSRLYYQCGGKNYNGPTECEAGTVCKAQNDYYHQCVADDSATATDDGDCSVVYVTAGASSSSSSSSAAAVSTSAYVSAPTSLYTTTSSAAPAPYSTTSSSSSYVAAPASSSSSSTSSYVAPAPSSYSSLSSSAAPVEPTTSAYSAPASSSSTTTQAATSAQSTAPAASGSGTTYTASFTEYGSTDTWGSGNCNVATTACGYYSSPGYAAAVSQNEFGVGPGAGAGPGCGKCWKLTAETDSSGATLSNAGNSIIVQVTNLCPSSGNPLCSQTGLTGTNQYGANLNFDLCIDSGASSALFGDSGVGLAVGSAVEVNCDTWSGSIVH